MLKIKDNIVKKDLILIGAGHSHIEVIKYLGKRKLNGLRITLIAKDAYATYSGMVPGYIEGEYTWSQINIDIVKLALKNNVRVIIDEAVKISGKNKIVYLKNHPFIEYDFLSINTGIESSKNNIEGAKEFAYCLKPISEIKSAIKSIIKAKEPKIVIVGAGAAGVEVSLALSKRFQKLKLKKKIILVSNNQTILKNYPDTVKKKLEKEIKKKNIMTLYTSRVTKVFQSSLEINNNEKIQDCCTLLATNGVASNIIKISDLSLSKNGFIHVNNTLQTDNFKNVFACGDIVDIENYNLAKAGVFAVRQANVLKKNLENYFFKKKLISYYPQKSYLSLIGITDNKALLHKNFITLKGKVFWHLKKYIDKKFIQKYSFKANLDKNFDYKHNKAINNLEPNEHMMQCEGCGSKVPHKVLKQVFTKNVNLGSLDANFIKGNKNLVHTVDIITSIIDDLYLLGRIAAKHSLNDLFAAKAQPVSTQMIISLPKSLNIIQKRDITQITQGANSIFEEVVCPISGGHTYSNENEKSSVGFSLIGKIITKKNTNTSNKKSKIFMTGKVGTALVMAALKKSIIEGKYYIELVEEMTKSNRDTFNLIRKHNILDVTDISGFGLAVHLKNLLIRNKHYRGADVFLDKICMLEGAKAALKKNVISSLTYSNKDSIKNSLVLKCKHRKYINILYDPQTAGGFLFITNNNNILKEFQKYNISISEIGEISNKHDKIRVY